MLNQYARGLTTRVFTPLAAWLLRRRVSPDTVTVVGTLGVVVAALTLYPLGHLLWASVIIAVFALADIVDGTMARLPQARELRRGGEDASRWGNFLDSSLDRLADGAIFSGLAIWYFTQGNAPGIGVAALACMFLGSVVSYVRAKAESLGYDAQTGIAERAERLVATLTAAAAVGLGLSPLVLFAVLGLLAVASAVTVWQRMARVRAQVLRRR